MKNINDFIHNFEYRSPYLNISNNNICCHSEFSCFECIEQYLTNFEKNIPNFADFIYEKLESSRFKDQVELYTDADIDRKRWHDLINNKSDRSSKDNFFKIAFSLKLPFDEADTLLATKGYCINQNHYRDKVLSYFLMDPDGKSILNKNSIDRNIEIDELLEQCNTATLYSTK